MTHRLLAGVAHSHATALIHHRRRLLLALTRGCALVLFPPPALLPLPAANHTGWPAVAPLPSRGDWRVVAGGGG